MAGSGGGGLVWVPLFILNAVFIYIYIYTSGLVQYTPLRLTLSLSLTKCGRAGTVYGHHREVGTGYFMINWFDEVGLLLRTHTRGLLMQRE
jgi:hypothetical protein